MNKVHGGNVRRVVTQKGAPSLAWRSASLDHVLGGGFSLGSGVITQRHRTVTLEHRARLNAEGFVWKVYEQDWERGFAAFLKFQKREGHCLVPQRHMEGGLRLGIWVDGQRRKKKKGSLSADRIARLNAEGFEWDPKPTWEEGLAAFLKFKERERHCLVPRGHMEGGFSLGSWVITQRRAQRNGSLSAERKKRLDAERFEWSPPKGFAIIREKSKVEGKAF